MNMQNISQGKTSTFAGLLMGSTILNIFLNAFAITLGLNHYREIETVFGAIGATILSRMFYLGGLVVGRRGRRG